MATWQGTWPPDTVPSLWRKVEIIHEDAVRVWAEGIDYLVGDEVAYPDADGMLYTCQQAHASQAGWEPPNTPALWLTKTQESTEGDSSLMDDAGQTEEA